MREMELQVTEAAVDDLVPYARNANVHTGQQVDQIAASIEEFGFCDPVGVWVNAQGEPEIVEGHGRVLAAKRLGMDTVPVIHLDALTDDQRRAYTHVHNQLTRNSGFDFETLKLDLDALEFDWGQLGFPTAGDGSSFFSDRSAYESVGDNDEYREFLQKFEVKKTDDDCYTPDNVYEVVADYVARTYGRDRSTFVRPFYPGGDYKAFDYSGGKVVVDNPPFSIMSEILDHYLENGIEFFLFCQGVTAFAGLHRGGVSAIATAYNLVYENGASVNTSFLTNMDDAKVRTAPDLYAALDEANRANLAEIHAQLDKYEYPACVLTSTRVGLWSRYGVDAAFYPDEVTFIRSLESQKPDGKAIYGAGFIGPESVCESAAREAREAREAIPWPLSESEREVADAMEEAHRRRSTGAD